MPGEPLPDWAEDALTLLDLVGDGDVGIDSHGRTLRCCARWPGTALPVWVDPDQPWRFHPGFRDWLAAARRDVDAWSAPAPIADSARQELVLDLARRQLAVSGAAADGGRRGSAAGRPALRHRRPGRLGGAVDDAPGPRAPAGDGLAAMARDHGGALRSDRRGSADDLSRVEVTRIELAQGDQHRGGRGVARLRLSDGTSVFLKPRADGLHRLLGAVLAQVDAAGTALGLRLPVIIERDGYSWAREVRPGDCPDDAAVDAYFRRAGALVRVAQAMGSNDLHHENFIPAARPSGARRLRDRGGPRSRCAPRPLATGCRPGSRTRPGRRAW